MVFNPDFDSIGSDWEEQIEEDYKSEHLCSFSNHEVDEKDFYDYEVEYINVEYYKNYWEKVKTLDDSPIKIKYREPVLIIKIKDKKTEELSLEIGEIKND